MIISKNCAVPNGGFGVWWFFPPHPALAGNASRKGLRFVQITMTKSYRTYIVTSHTNAHLINEMGIDGEWRLSIKDDASFRHWSTPNDENSRVTLFGEITDERIKQYKEQYIQCKEVIIETDDESTATNVASLIQTGTLLGYPNILDAPKHSGVSEINDELEKSMCRKPFCDFFTFQENAYYGSQIAIKGWKEASMRYAIEKYRLSLELDSFTPQSASPNHGQIFLNQYPEYSYHVKAATAFLLAYSVIEELGLEIRSSSKKPRWKDGKWNSEVRTDVENRLQTRGINLSESVSWIYRGELLPLELEVSPSLGQPADYSDGKIVRDREMEVVDALHVASYIRNFIIAHKYSELVNHLGPYDVHNVQLLARRLILSSLGLYKNF